MTENSPKVLILEDSRDLLALYTAYLGKAKAELFFADNCQKALEILAEEKPKVLIMDLTLGDMSTAEFYEKFTAIPQSEEVNMILISGRDDLPSWADLFNAKGFLQKPVSKESLLKVVQENL